MAIKKTGKKKNIKIPELCVPAGNLNILKYAIAYGADAVYIGGSKFNLRNFSDNFSTNDFIEAFEYCKSYGRKVYLALNAIVDEKELKELKSFIAKVEEIDFDAIIISDPGVLGLVKSKLPNRRIHISTQTSTTNHAAVNFWAEAGASRVNLARELGYESIKNICRKSKIEIEVFVHGALCISYSGRCMLSKYLSGRDANKGQCSHTCRWKYYLMEEKRPNTFFPVDQDGRGTYIYNSRDLCLLEEVDLLAKAGVDSLKIEGRMKTENYVSLVTWVYRKALDLVKCGQFDNIIKKSLLHELDKSTHRTFTKGFMFARDNKEPSLTENDNVGYVRKYRFAGSIEGFNDKYGGPLIRARNQVKKGNIIDILQPGEEDTLEITAGDMIMYNNGEITDTVNTNDLFIMPGIKKLSEFAILKVRL